MCQCSLLCNACKQPGPAGTGNPGVVHIPIAWSVSAGRDEVGSLMVGCTSPPPPPPLQAAPEMLQVADQCCAGFPHPPGPATHCTDQYEDCTGGMHPSCGATANGTVAGTTSTPGRQHSPAMAPQHVPAPLQQAAESAPPTPLLLAQIPESHGTRLAAGISLRRHETAGGTAPALLRVPTAAREPAGWQAPPGSSSREGWQLS